MQALLDSLRKQYDFTKDPKVLQAIRDIEKYLLG